MFGFGKKAGPTIALDINGYTISLMQLERTKTDLKVVKFASTMTPPELVREGLLVDPEQAGEVLRGLLDDAGYGGKTPRTTINLAIPGQQVVLKPLQVPKVMPNDELNEVVRQEAINNLPFAIDDANLDWRRVPGTIRLDPDGVEREEVLLGAIPSTVAETYQRMCQAAGVTLGKLEVSSLVALRALAFAGQLGEPGVLSLLVNIRHDATDICLVNGSVQLFSRSVLLGVETVVEAIGRSINITTEEAFSLLSRVALLGVPTVDPRTGQAAQVTRSVCSDLTAEVGRSLEFYMSQYGMVRVDQVVVSGAGVCIPEIDQFIANRLNLETIVANPFEEIVYDPNQILDERRPFHTMLVGLLVEPDMLQSKTVSIDLNKAGAELLEEYEEEDEELADEEIPTPWLKPGLIVGSILAGLVLVAWLVVQSYLFPQKVEEEVNLDQEISQTKSRLETLNKAKSEIQALEERKAALQRIVTPGMPVSTLLETLTKNTPKGVQIFQIKFNGNSVIILGRATDFSKVSHLAINLNGSNVFSTAEIQYIKRLKERPSQINFELSSTLTPEVGSQVAAEPPTAQSSSGESAPVAVVTGAQGKPRVLEFHASWCPPCQRMQPFLEEAKRRYGQQVQFISIDVDDPSSEALKRQYGVETVPMLFFLDGSGQVQERIKGFGGSPSPIYKACERLSKLASRSPTR